MQSTITFEITDNPVESIRNLHQAVFDFSYAMMEFYQKKRDKEGRDDLHDTLLIWAISANILRAPTMAFMVGGNESVESIQELSDLSKDFADRTVGKIKQKLVQEILS